jgi:hypothetical protein
MSGGTTEIYRDSDPLVEAVHQGATGSGVFYNKTLRFDVLVSVGLYAENSDTGEGGYVSEVRQHEIELIWTSGTDVSLEFGEDGLTFGTEDIYFSEAARWSYGDTLKVYKTAVKNSVISTQWTDLNGMKTPMVELVSGYRPEDIDEDREL